MHRIINLLYKKKKEKYVLALLVIKIAKIETTLQKKKKKHS